MRVRIPAREVILATSEPEGLSLHNALSGTVSAINADPAFDHVVVQIAVAACCCWPKSRETRSHDWASPSASRLYALDQVGLDRGDSGVPRLAESALITNPRRGGNAESFSHHHCESLRSLGAQG